MEATVQILCGTASRGGIPITEKKIRLYCASIIGQCLYYYNAMSIIRQLYHQDVSKPDEIEGIGDHIMEFSLRGLEHYSKHNGDGAKKEKESQGSN